jgi:hypothetical protein
MEHLSLTIDDVFDRRLMFPDSNAAPSEYQQVSFNGGGHE